MSTSNDETSASLLEAIRADSANSGWNELARVYTPFVRAILLRHGLRRDEVDDFVQDIMLVLVRRIPEFERQRKGSFRAWLRSITINCLRDHWRSRQRHGKLAGCDSQLQGLLEQLEDPHSRLTDHWNRQHDDYVFAYLLQQVQREFRPRTWQAFHMLTVEQRDVDEVAEVLGISPNAAFVNRSRVFKRLRELGASWGD